MISRYDARTVAIEQICDLITAQVHCGWADDYILDAEICDNKQDIEIIAQEAEKFVKLLEKQAMRRRLKKT